MRIFWFHYNKPESNFAGKPQITVHYNNVCYLVDNIFIHVKTFGHINKRQPYFVIKGKCNKINIRNNIAYVE